MVSQSFLLWSNFSRADLHFCLLDERTSWKKIWTTRTLHNQKLTTNKSSTQRSTLFASYLRWYMAMLKKCTKLLALVKVSPFFEFSVVRLNKIIQNELFSYRIFLRSVLVWFHDSSYITCFFHQPCIEVQTAEFFNTDWAAHILWRASIWSQLHRNGMHYWSWPKKTHNQRINDVAVVYHSWCSGKERGFKWNKSFYDWDTTWAKLGRYFMLNEDDTNTKYVTKLGNPKR